MNLLFQSSLLSIIIMVDNNVVKATFGRMEDISAKTSSSILKDVLCSAVAEQTVKVGNKEDSSNFKIMLIVPF